MVVIVEGLGMMDNGFRIQDSGFGGRHPGFRVYGSGIDISDVVLVELVQPCVLHIPHNLPPSDQRYRGTSLI